MTCLRKQIVCLVGCFTLLQGALAQTPPASPTGNTSQDFGGIRTFLRAPYVKDIATLDADIAVVGMPFDRGTSNRPGQRYGPRDIREASLIYAWAPENGFYYIDTGVTVLEGQRLEVFANGTAIVAGEGTAKGTDPKGAYVMTYQSTNVLIKRDGAWRAVSSHVSGVKRVPSVSGGTS